MQWLSSHAVNGRANIKASEETRPGVTTENWSRDLEAQDNMLFRHAKSPNPHKNTTEFLTDLTSLKKKSPGMSLLWQPDSLLASLWHFCHCTVETTCMHRRHKNRLKLPVGPLGLRGRHLWSSQTTIRWVLGWLNCAHFDSSRANFLPHNTHLMSVSSMSLSSRHVPAKDDSCEKVSRDSHVKGTC